MTTPDHVNSKSKRNYGPELPPGTPDEFGVTSMLLDRRSLLAPSTLRHVTRVSKRAALATKKQIWDSNDASIVAAQSAVDQWEQGYNALRGLLGMVGASASGVYGAAKAGAIGLEHGFLLPVRDWILLPAFGGVEHAVGETVGFLQSQHAQTICHQGLDVIRQVPFIGDVCAHAVCGGAEILKRSWEIAQYPIPSPTQVRTSVDFVMTGTKFILTRSGEEILMYVKRADANITRTLSHTRWKVLGSGPYATLDKLNKAEVIDHLCERYFSLVDMIARYELAAHIRAHNRPLYHDLVLTGLLRERGGNLTLQDEWLSSLPSYRKGQSTFLLDDKDDDASEESSSRAFALWFRLPYYNGKRPGKDVPWVQFDNSERLLIEDFYRCELKKRNDHTETPSTGTESREPNGNTLFGDSQKYATNAKWYNPDLYHDLLLDQKRHAISLFACCPKCRKRHDVSFQVPLAPKQFGELCNSCSEQESDAPWVDSLLSPPPLNAVLRPTLWRSYGPGDELRRATWFLDTQFHGLQPYGEDAQGVLEDAYLFLKWRNAQKNMPSTLLTVQVSSPDGSENQLVQFTSLTSATAIGKGLKGAITLFKRRVYRGAYHKEPTTDKKEESGACQEEEVEEAVSLEKSQKSFLEKSQEENALTSQDESLIGGSENTDNRLKTKQGDASFLINNDRKDSEKPNGVAIVPVDNTGTKAKDKEPMSLAYRLDQLEVKPNDETAVNSENDSVDHLVLIVHGIGEMLLNFDLFGFSKVPTIVDCCGFLRKNHAEVLNVRFSQMYQTLDGIPQPRRGRVEYLPIEWHESFTIQSRRRLLRSASPENQRPSNYTINDVSLRTIPQLRQFANDTLMDVLYFMSPEHHDIITDIVVNEMNFVVERFRKLTGFSGDVSVVGHSLGSIITWDILDNQKKHIPPVPRPKGGEGSDSSSRLRCNTEINKESVSDDPESVSPIEEDRAQSKQGYPQLCFDVDNAFMLGSPIAVFLMIRNPRKPLNTNFTLSGCSRVFNIFHPYDPVAYRMEPLLDPKNAEIEPRIMTHWHGGFRFQYQTKRLWRKIVQTTLRTQDSVVEGLESGFAALGLLDAANETDDEDEDGADNGSDSPYVNHSHSTHRVEMGSLNRGQRIDYMLQEKEIENANEYVAALAAHSSYWLEKDLSLFIARQICLRALERETSEDASFSRYNGM